MSRHVICILGVLIVAVTPAAAMALSFTDVVIEGEVGSGSSESMIVIDWDTGSTPSHAWLLRWDGAVSYTDAFDAIDAFEGADFDWSGGGFVQFMSYDDGSELHTTGSLGWLSFWQSVDGASWAVTDLGVDDQLLVDGGWAGANANLPEVWPGDAPSVPIPEPASALLLAIGLALFGARRRTGALVG